MVQGGDDTRGRRAAANRFQARHALLLDGFRHVVSDSTVLVLGAGNGQWCYAYAAAGALNVIGIDGDQTLVDGFSDLPDIGLRERIEMRCSEPFVELDEEVRCLRQHDIVALLDVLSGQADLHWVFRQVAALAPRMVIVDDIFASSHEPILLLHGPAKQGLPPLLPSTGALEQVARETGFEVNPLDWNALEEEDRIGLADYYQTGRVRRASYALIPAES